MGPEQNYGYQTPNYNFQTEKPNTAKKIFILVGIGVAILSVLLLIVVMLFSSSGSRKQVGGIMGNYQEISRISELAQESTSARRDTKNIASTLRTTSLSNQAKITAFADENYSSPFRQKTLNDSKVSGADESLEEAARQNSYDQQFSEIMLSLLEDTNNKITATFNEFPNDSDLESLLNDLGSQNQVIIDQLSAL